MYFAALMQGLLLHAARAINLHYVQGLQEQRALVSNAPGNQLCSLGNMTHMAIPLWVTSNNAHRRGKGQGYYKWREIRNVMENGKETTTRTPNLDEKQY